MFKTLKTLLAGILAAVIVIAIGASAYTAFAAPSTNNFSTQSQTASMNGNGNGGNGTGTSVLDIPASDLSADEAAALLFMREEEKLARDVYNTLSATWGIQSFSNIASSEQMHMDEIKVLLDRYALTDPALAPGQFTDPDTASFVHPTRRAGQSLHRRRAESGRSHRRDRHPRPANPHGSNRQRRHSTGLHQLDERFLQSPESLHEEFAYSNGRNLSAAIFDRRTISNHYFQHKRQW